MSLNHRALGSVILSAKAMPAHTAPLQDAFTAPAGHRRLGLQPPAALH